jgi:hypothetical protein
METSNWHRDRDNIQIYRKQVGYEGDRGVADLTQEGEKLRAHVATVTALFGYFTMPSVSKLYSVEQWYD